ncbi:MAG: acyl carrier protein [Pseudonocardiales bacterium]|nr:acyl carrier protein [Pseudonocardiales bacterium]MBV9030158.1 acyl carrier protein [Pseudonocardiales bacterium]MBW0011058.1 acyl carrier protein [Pseudonocardiales bacterium]
MKDLLSRVEMLLCTRFGVGKEEFQADAVLADLDLDSLTLVEFGLVAEKEFGIRVGADEISPNDTVADLVQLIHGKGMAA